MEKPSAPTSRSMDLAVPVARAGIDSPLEKGAASKEEKGAASSAKGMEEKGAASKEEKGAASSAKGMEEKGVASSASTMEEKGAASCDSTEEKGTATSNWTMEEKGAGTRDSSDPGLGTEKKRPHRPLPRPLTFAQWSRKEDAWLKKNTQRMMELFPDFNPDEEYANSNSEDLSGWESGSDDGADDSMPNLVVDVPHPNIKPDKEDNNGGKVVDQEGDGDLSDAVTMQDGGFTNPTAAEGDGGQGGWVTVRKYHGGRPQLRRRIGK